MATTTRGLATQAAISEEIVDAHRAAGVHTPQPRLDFAPYRSSVLRHPTQRLWLVDPEAVERMSPVFGDSDVDPVEADLTLQDRGEPIGERLVVTGRVLDGEGHPVRHQLVEIWQANAAGGTSTSVTSIRRRSIRTSRVSAGV